MLGCKQAWRRRVMMARIAMVLLLTVPDLAYDKYRVLPSSYACVRMIRNTSGQLLHALTPDRLESHLVVDRSLLVA